MNTFLNARTTNYCAKTLSLLVLLLGTLAFDASAQNFGLDVGFNPGVTDAPPFNYVSVAQPDGKVLVGGFFNFANGVQRCCFTRFNADGTLDNSFNPGGVGTSGVVVGTSGAVLDIIVLGDGKILIAGSFGGYNGEAKKDLARLNSDGTLDNSFNPGGAGANPEGSLTSIALQADGKIVAAGPGVTGYNGITNNGVFRVNVDGTLDTSFVSGFGTSTYIEVVAVQSDGKFVIALNSGTTYGGVTVGTLVRLNADATLDSSFNNTGGPDNTGLPGMGMAIQPDGKILVGGSFETYNGTPRNAIARVNADGTLDTSFVPPTFEPSRTMPNSSPFNQTARS